jgi:hypothetical protein
MLYIPDIVAEPDPVDGLISRACMARYLLGLMAEDFSQTYHFVSWTEDTPFLFWDAVHGNEVEGSFGPVTLPAEARRLIHELAIVSGGWWTHHPNHSKPDDSFIPMECWLQILAERNNHRSP